MICEEFGVSEAGLYKWVSIYREHGEEGLRQRRRRGSSPGKVPVQVKEKIAEIKARNPLFGIRRISDVLMRFLHMRASPETVRRTLQESTSAEHGSENRPAARSSRRNVTRPRYFERATPNQMWQSDIFTFRLGGRYAYLIGFIDDYSRYMVGLGLYMSQTSENVMEVFRKAMAEYGVPKEMLTDNGRQYASWRGTTKFERELAKEKIRHIRSRPHHPMTLGKIERFWKTIYQEFLDRAQFETFESARERIAFWTKYYNHRRPHQGIGGLCPADRFFEIQGELRKVIERKIEENTLELALRGKQAETFYMVGRLGEKSVVLTAEKGKMKLSVDGNEKELENGEFIHEIGKAGAEEAEKGVQDVHRGGEMPGGPVGVVGEEKPRGDLQGAGAGQGPVQEVAGAGAAGYLRGAGSEKGPGQMLPAERKAGEAAGAEAVRDGGPEAGGGKAEAAAGEAGGGAGPERGIDAGTEVAGRDTGGHPEGQAPGDHGEEGRRHPGHVPEELLQVGEPGACRNGGGPCGASARTPLRPAGGSGKGGAPQGGRGPQGAAARNAEAPGAQGHGAQDRAGEPRR